MVEDGIRVELELLTVVEIVAPEEEDFEEVTIAEVEFTDVADGESELIDALVDDATVKVDEFDAAIIFCLITATL